MYEVYGTFNYLFFQIISFSSNLKKLRSEQQNLFLYTLCEKKSSQTKIKNLRNIN